MTARHVISLSDLSDEDLHSVMVRGARFAGRSGADGAPLAGTVTGILFRRTSTRTRTAFSAGAQRLGGGIVTFRPEELQLATGETAEDTGAVFARMLDIMVARTADDQAEMRAWAALGGMSVVNAMSAQEHPTQGLTDLTTLHRRFGRIEGLRVLYVGEGNNTAAALALGLTRFRDVHLHLATPPGYGLSAEIGTRAAKQAAANGSTLTESQSLEDVPERMDVVYTTRWQTTGTSKADPDWRRLFEPFQVTGDLWRASPDALFMHDLPAHRGDEVTAEVLDGPRSIAFEQAENKMWSAMAVLEWCANGVVERRGA
ncbi:ornithine carbamoyltransferase [Actinomadura rubrisoli]|uniref:Ornithine carbamoyltransferase n=1 Tax=Actinomadura rubrisoli TaxID=2530368 RepID=A0A4R5C530_9ACTN|nr:ornithine carbamoyltransferase [Actinomadura rubrisoli]TDD94831.1 ornithine carbamoyltransferase [Actinomadura rubrisoli]